MINDIDTPRGNTAPATALAAAQAEICSTRAPDAHVQATAARRAMTDYGTSGSGITSERKRNPHLASSSSSSSSSSSRSHGNGNVSNEQDPVGYVSLSSLSLDDSSSRHGPAHATPAGWLCKECHRYNGADRRDMVIVTCEHCAAVHHSAEEMVPLMSSNNNSDGHHDDSEPDDEAHEVTTSLRGSSGMVTNMHTGVGSGRSGRTYADIDDDFNDDDDEEDEISHWRSMMDETSIGHHEYLPLAGSAPSTVRISPASSSSAAAGTPRRVPRLPPPNDGPAVASLSSSSTSSPSSIASLSSSSSSLSSSTRPPHRLKEATDHLTIADYEDDNDDNDYADDHKYHGLDHDHSDFSITAFEAAKQLDTKQLAYLLSHGSLPSSLSSSSSTTTKTNDDISKGVVSPGGPSIASLSSTPSLSSSSTLTSATVSLSSASTSTSNGTTISSSSTASASASLVSAAMSSSIDEVVSLVGNGMQGRYFVCEQCTLENVITDEFCDACGFPRR
jgi:hypothetical protein